MAVVSGAQLIARTLRDLGITVVFGIGKGLSEIILFTEFILIFLVVGIPVVEIAEEAINLGIRFIAFRNEQACSYAASVYGYMTGRPGVCLVVGGPGVLHALAGVSPPALSSPSHPSCVLRLTIFCDTDWQCFRE